MRRFSSICALRTRSSSWIVDRTAYRLYRRAEFGEHTVTRDVENAPIVARNQPINHDAMRLESAQRVFLVFGREPAIAEYVRSEDRGKSALLSAFSHGASHACTLQSSDRNCSKWCSGSGQKRTGQEFHTISGLCGNT